MTRNLQGAGDRLPPSRGPKGKPLTSILCRIRRRRLADSAPPKGRGRDEPTSLKLRRPRSPPSPRLRRDSLLCAARGPIYVFAKRTHRFTEQEHDLSNRQAMCYAGKFSEKTVGSFWKTNPPGGGFEGRFNEKWLLLPHTTAASRRTRLWENEATGGLSIVVLCSIRTVL